MKKFLFPRVCNAYMGFLALLSLFCFLAGVFLGDRISLYALLIFTAPLPLIFTLTRYYSKNFFIFWIMHLLPTVACLFVKVPFGDKLALLTFVITLSLVSVYEKLKEKYNFEVYTLAYAIFIGVLQLFCGALKMEICIRLTLVSIIIYTVLYTSSRGFYNLETFVSENRDLSNFPLKRIKASGIAVNTVFPLGFVLLLAFLPYDRIDVLFRVVSDYLYKGFYFLMGLLPFKGNGQILSREEEIAFISGNMNKQQEDMMNFMGIPETNHFIKFLGKFGLFCSYVIVAVLVIFLLRLVFKFIYNAYGKHSAGDNTIDIRESLDKVYEKDSKKKKTPFRERFTRQNRIREKFKRRVIKENKNKPIKGKTPTELVSDLTLVENYEIIRYGKEK